MVNFGTATLLVFTAAMSAAKGFAPGAGRSLAATRGSSRCVYYSIFELVLYFWTNVWVHWLQGCDDLHIWRGLWCWCCVLKGTDLAPFGFTIAELVRTTVACRITFCNWELIKIGADEGCFRSKTILFAYNIRSFFYMLPTSLTEYLFSSFYM